MVNKAQTISELLDKLGGATEDEAAGWSNILKRRQAASNEELLASVSFPFPSSVSSTSSSFLAPSVVSFCLRRRRSAALAVAACTMSFCIVTTYSAVAFGGI
jgi:hypothetical protein